MAAGRLSDFMNEGVVSTFSAAVELELKGNDETHRFAVNLEPTPLSPCSRHAPGLFQMTFQVTSSFPCMKLSRLSMRHIGSDGPSHLWRS